MPIERIDPDRCNSCGLCVDCCAMDVIYIYEETNKAYPGYPKDWVACYNCERECPVKAIYVSPRMGRQVPKAW